MQTFWSKMVLSKYPVEARLFVAASFINSFGSALMWPLTSLYVHNVLHRSYADAGLVLLLQSLAGIFGQITGGSLYRKLGPKMLLVPSLFLTGTAQISVMFTHVWGLYIAIMTLSGFLMAISMPVIQAVIGSRWSNQSRELFNVVYVSNNMGMAVGTTLSGLLATLSFSLLFVCNGLSTIGFACFFFLFFQRKSSQTEKRSESGVANQLSPQAKQSVGSLLRNYHMFLLMGVGSMLIWMSTSAWGVGVAPFLDEQGLGMELYSLLWTINGFVIFAGQPIVGLITRTFAQTLGIRLVASAMLYMAGFVLMLVFHTHYSSFIVGMVIATFGEMLIAPTIPAFLTEKAKEYAAFYLGVVGGFGSLGRLIGPYLYGNMYDRHGLVPILLTSSIFTMTAVISFAFHAFFHRDTWKVRTKMKASI